MLVVIGVITFLVAAIVVVLPRVQNSAKTAATRATISKVDKLLSDRMKGFQRWIQNEDKRAGSNPGNIPSYALDSMAEAGNNIALAKVLGMKKRFRENFPQSYAEFGGTFGTAHPRGASHQSVTDSAEALYLVLTAAPIYDTEPAAAAEFRSSELADTDGDGLLEIVDAWGHPLRFYRWPTRLIRPASDGSESAPQAISTPGEYDLKLRPGFTNLPGQSARLLISAIIVPPLPPATQPTTFVLEASQPLAKDPDDPLGLIDSVYINGASTAATTFENNYHTPATYTIPLIVSSGPDEQLGLFEPYDTARHGHLCQPVMKDDDSGQRALFDNITNHQQ